MAPTQLGSGPFGAMLLGDLGAEVIKIENPKSEGDEARRVPPYAEENDSLYYQSLNRNTKSLTLDLQSELGQRIFRKLVAVSDVVFNNLRGDLPGKLAMTYPALKDSNPRIVCVSLSGFGRTGPRMTEPGYDYLFQAYSGFMSVTGDPEGPPTKCGISIIDFAGGLTAAAAVSLGLYQANKTGVGCDVDIGLLDSAISMLSYFAIWTLNAGYKPMRTKDSAHATLVPSQSFATKDGWMVVMCMKQKFWERLCDIIGTPGLKAEPRFASLDLRYRNREELLPALKQIFKTRTTEEWLTLLRNQVPCAPVNTIEQALGDAQVLAREMIVEVEHPKFGKMKQVGCPVKFQGVRPVYRRAAALGESNEDLLKGLLKMSSSEIAGLRKDKVI